MNKSYPSIYFENTVSHGSHDLALESHDQALESNLIIFSNGAPTNLAYYKNPMPYLPSS